ncbi:MAG TPA: BolA family transcriptional regulator [Myxococcota bacterium]|nr:BolA family transcriptional regulator [Myxococcota bacterium]
MNRRERIEILLRGAFAPLELVVTDESAKHRGHAGAAGGAGHFRVRLVSERFRGAARVARHRMVYDALAAEIGPEIHALALELAAPEEP